MGPTVGASKAATPIFPPAAEEWPAVINIWFIKDVVVDFPLVPVMPMIFWPFRVLKNRSTSQTIGVRNWAAR